jgi:hypothetical protein
MRIAKLGISGTEVVLLQGLYGQSLGFDVEIALLQP